MPVECVAEMKARCQKSMHSLLVTKEQTGLGQILKCENFSILKRLLSVTAQLLKFGGVLKQRIKPGLVTEISETARAETL